MKHGNQENTDRCLDEFQEFIRKERGEDYLKEVSEKIEQLRDESFLDGYQYAIQILEDGMPKKNLT